MKRLRNALILLGILGGSGFVAYQLLLTDDARQSLSKGATTVKDGVATIKEMIDEKRGIVMEDDQPLPNVESTRQEWESIGY